METSTAVKENKKAPEVTPNLTPEKERKQYVGVAARAMKMMAAGATQEETAKALGVVPSLISQFMAEEEYKNQLHELINKSFQEANEIDSNYQEIERVLSARLRDQAALMFSPDQVLRALKFANEAKRKVAANLQNNGTNGNGQEHGGVKLQPAILILPTVVRREFILNPQNEIVGVDGQELVTLNSTSLNKLVEAKKVKKLPNGTSNQPKDPYSDL